MPSHDEVTCHFFLIRCWERPASRGWARSPQVSAGLRPASVSRFPEPLLAVLGWTRSAFLESARNCAIHRLRLTRRAWDQRREHGNGCQERGGLQLLVSACKCGPCHLGGRRCAEKRFPEASWAAGVIEAGCAQMHGYSAWVWSRSAKMASAWQSFTLSVTNALSLCWGLSPLQLLYCAPEERSSSMPIILMLFSSGLCSYHGPMQYAEDREPRGSL